MNVYSVDIFPIMTSNTAPSPYVVTFSSRFSTGEDGWMAFNDNPNNIWSSSGTLPAWLKIDIGANTYVANVLTMTSRNDNIAYVPYTAKDFTLAGSNDDVTYTTLLTASAATWGLGTKQAFPFSNSASYRYYKINVTANQGTSNNTSFAEVELLAYSNLPTIVWDNADICTDSGSGIINPFSGRIIQG
jgi:hypothetical protein